MGTATIIVGNLTDPQFIQTVVSQIHLPDKIQLKDLYSDEDYKYLRQFFLDSLKTDLNDQKNQYLPYVFVNMLIEHIINCEPQGAETKVVKFAQVNSIAIKGLESPETLFESLKNVDLKIRAHFLLQFVKNYDAIVSNFKAVKMNYSRPERIDIDFLLNFTRFYTDEHRRSFIEDRNKNWMLSMNDAIARQAACFVVPEYHLGGRNGLLNLLAEAGYELRSVENLVNINNLATLYRGN